MDIKKIKFDDFVNKVNDPSQKPAHKFTVSGYVGKSPTANHIRIYADASLDHYIEVGAADVIHQEPLHTHGNSSNGSILWIKSGANISHGSHSYHYDPKNNYFKGDIADAFGGPPTTIPSVNCAGGAPTKTIASMCCPGPPTLTMPSMCCDGGVPTKSIPSLCCDGGRPTLTIASMCCPGPPTSNMRTYCCSGGRPTLTIVSKCCPAPPTTNMRTFCCDGGLPTSGMRSYCCEGGRPTLTIVSMCCPGPPTTNMRSFCCDGGLPTSGMRSYCCDMNDVGAHIPSYTGCNVTFNCGTGGYNPYDGF